MKIIFSLLSLALSILVSAQNNVPIVKSHTNSIDEKSLREKMKNDGLSSTAIDELIAKRKRLFDQSIQVKTVNPIPYANCDNMGGENGWSAWTGDVGTVGSCTFTMTPPAGIPASPNFVLTTGTGIDPCTPGPTPGNPPLPVVAPNSGHTSIRLGDPQQSGSVVEQLTYPISVTTQDTFLTVDYALVIEDAGTGHTVCEQPYVSFCIYDSKGDSVPCGYFRYTGGPNIPGFFQGSCNILSTPYYKPWSTFNVDLSAYIGQTLSVVITNADCTQGAHFAHSYWDFSCMTEALKPEYCGGQSTTLCAPANSGSGAYSYQWYKNHTVFPGGNTQCISAIPQKGDTFSVAVQQQSGCSFNMTYIPQDTCDVTFSSTIDICKNINTFPNPSGGVFSIKFDEATTFHLDIYNLVGEIVYQSKFNNPKNIIDISSQPNGIYFLKVKTDKGFAVKKIMKE